MPHTVPAIGAAAITASGCVWYLPAVLDLCAGDDRPRSTRLAALATVSWWLSAALAGVLLLTPISWQLAAVPVIGGGVPGVLLRLMAAAERRADHREEAGRWAAIRYDPIPASPRRPPQAVLLAWLAAGLGASFATAVLVLRFAPGSAAGAVLALAVGGSVMVCLLALLLAATRARP